MKRLGATKVLRMLVPYASCTSSAEFLRTNVEVYCCESRTCFYGCGARAGDATLLYELTIRAMAF